MSVTLEQTIGNSVIRIHDDCCRDTSEETALEILKRVSAYARAENLPSSGASPQTYNTESFNPCRR